MDDEILKLLTEIRDNQRDQLAIARELRELNNRSVEESLCMQRLAIRRQTIGIVIAVVLVAIFLLALVLRP